MHVQSVYNQAKYIESPLDRGRRNGRMVLCADGVKRYVWRVDADPGCVTSYQIEEIDGILHANVMPTPLKLGLTLKIPS